MEPKEKEIWIGESRLYLGDDNIMYETIVGDFDEQTAKAALEASLKLIENAEGQVKLLIDVNRAGKPSKEARDIFIKFHEQKNLGKIAIFGLHPVARVLASFGMGLSRKEDMRFFKTREEALSWLKKGGL